MIDVLFVDDESAFLEQAEIFLEKEDRELDVETVGSAEKALESLSNSEYDVVVSDYQMPEVNGLEFLETLREERGNEIPFIIFTGKGREEVAVEALNLGADRYLQKGGDPKSQYGVLADAIKQEVKHWSHEKELRSIDWLLSKEVEEHTCTPSYGDLTELNTRREIMDLVGKDTLKEIADNFMSLLDTSCAVYEKNGDYALGIFASNWCKFLDEKSRYLCNTDDNQEALECGEWLCHESCWNASKSSIEKGEPVDVECSGGIHLYAVPIRAGDEIIGSINFGYGEPPKNPDKLKELSKKYDVSLDKLRKNAKVYESRPQFIIEIAKNRLRTSAKLIGEIVEKKKAEERVKRERDRAQRYLETAEVMMVSINREGEVIEANRKASEVLGYDKEEVVGKDWFRNFVPEEHRKEVKDVHQDIKKGEYPKYYENPVLTKSGEERTILWHNSALKDEEDNIIGTLSSGMDITERKKGEKELKRRTEMLEGMLDGLQDVIGFQEPDHTIIRYNQAGYEILDMSPEEARGKKCYELLGREEECEKCATNKALKTKNIETVEKYQPELDKYLRATSNPILDDNNEVIFVIEQLQDITERKKSEKKFEKLLDTSPDPTYLVDKNGVLKNFNKALVELVGYEREEMIGKRLSEAPFFPPEAREKVTENFKKRLQGEEVPPYLIEGETKNGDRLFAEVNANLIEEEGEPVGEIGIARDITELKESKESKDFLNTLLRQDLGSKFQTIQGYHQLLEKEADLPEKQKEYLRRAIESGKEADEVLALAKELDEIEKIELITEKDVIEVLEHAIEEISDLIENEGIKIEQSYPETLSNVEGNYSLITLFSETIATRIQVSGTNKTKISVKEKEETVLVTIRDDGKQLPKDIKDIFTGKAYTGETTGAGGVRYYILNEIAKHNNAKIKAKDSKLGGTRFELYLQKA